MLDQLSTAHLPQPLICAQAQPGPPAISVGAAGNLPAAKPARGSATTSRSRGLGLARYRKRRGSPRNIMRAARKWGRECKQRREVEGRAPQTGSAHAISSGAFLGVE